MRAPPLPPGTTPATAETRLIERLTRRLARPPAASRRLVLGIGDDAAIFRARPGEDWVISTDFSLEGVHFLSDELPAEAIGFHALARAASDLGAMGARPEFFLLAMALPPAREGRWLDRMLEGMARAAGSLGLRPIGGDTTRSSKPVLAVTVLGRVARGKAIRRDGARPGDWLYVSGRLGAAALGLSLIRRRARKRFTRALGHRQREERRLLRPQLYPSIPLALGRHLAERRLASAMIDLSDGLSSDLARLARSSGVGARIYLDRLPLARVPRSLDRLGIDPVGLALHGGEDYGLLFAVPAVRVSEIPDSFHGTPITRIGEMVRGRQVLAVDSAGRARALAPAGWDPFRRSKRG